MSGRRVLLLILATLVFQSGCALVPDADQEISVHTEGDTIFYTGPMYQSGAQAFLGAIKNAQTPITTLVINSGGGDIAAGMAMGEAVLENNLSVRVEEECFSSCANYILTTATSISLGEGAAYGWHGGAYQPLYFPITEEYFPGFKSYFHEMQPRETELFRKAGVYQVVTVLPMLPDFGEERNAAVYTFDKATLQQLGLHALAEAEAQEKPRCFVRREKELCTQIFTLHSEQVNALIEQFAEDKAKWDKWLAAEMITPTDAISP